jgi:RecA-family ATPase
MTLDVSNRRKRRGVSRRDADGYQSGETDYSGRISKNGELRLDRHNDRQALAATIARLQPKLLSLDPFVRLQCIDENVAAEVAPILGYLRSLQRTHHTGVALVHHARKGAAHERGGQALRCVDLRDDLPLLYGAP